MLIAIEQQSSPFCETVLRDQPDTGVAFLPAVPLRFSLQPQELRLQYEAGRLRYHMIRGDYAHPEPSPLDVVRLYRETARRLRPPSAEPDGKHLNETA